MLVISANKLHANSDTAARLVHAGYAVYGIDQEGHGKSSGSKGYISSFSDIVKDCAHYFKSVCGKEFVEPSLQLHCRYADLQPLFLFCVFFGTED
jgi:alpha-beta hydrolase superfamily lysophospholipase